MVSKYNLIFGQSFAQRVWPIMEANQSLFKGFHNLISDYTSVGIVLQDALRIYLYNMNYSIENLLFTDLVMKSREDTRLDEYFFDNFIRSELKYITTIKAANKSRGYFELKGMRPEYADMLEELVSSPESQKIYSRPLNTGNSPMKYGADLPEISKRDLYFLVNNYSKKRKECVGLCLLKSRPDVVLTGTHAGKLLPNINPFRLLNGEIIKKYSLDIEQLIKVGDFLLDYTFDSIKKCLDLLLTEYYEKSQLKSLLYADCLIGFYIWGLIDQKTFPFSVKWNSNIEQVHPLHTLANYGWIFFDMIMNFSHLICMLKKKVTVEKNGMVVVANVEKLENEMKKFLNYNQSAYDGYMSNYYNSRQELSTNCILSTLLEACILQESGIPTYEIFLRLEMQPLGDLEMYKRLFSNIEPKFKGSFKATHWTTRYKNKKFRSVFELCTDKEINFGEHKLEVAMAILYPILIHTYSVIEENSKLIANKIFEEIHLTKNIEDLLRQFHPKRMEAKALIGGIMEKILHLEHQLRYILENKIPKSLVTRAIDLQVDPDEELLRLEHIILKKEVELIKKVNEKNIT